MTRLVTPTSTHPHPRDELVGTKGGRTHKSWLQTQASVSLSSSSIFPPEPLSQTPTPCLNPYGADISLTESHLSVPSGGRVLFWGCRWASELSVFTLSRSESGVSVVPAGVILGKELSCVFGGKGEEQ